MVQRQGTQRNEHLLHRCVGAAWLCEQVEHRDGPAEHGDVLTDVYPRRARMHIHDQRVYNVNVHSCGLKNVPALSRVRVVLPFVHIA